jgi:DNA-binding response OmpR family regulator
VTTNPSVLVVEDDADTAQVVEENLRDMGCEVEVARDGQAGLDRALSSCPDVIVLDIQLPRIDGLEVCRRLRAREPYVPLLMLSGRATELDRVVGLELGADDYLCKPFSIRELQARVRALLRRRDAAAARDLPEGARLQRGGLLIDLETRVVTVQGHPARLTALEYDLLLHLARHPGRVYTRGELLEQVWRYAHGGYGRTINSHVNRLRAKIEEDPARPRYVLTVRGVGYRFAPGAGDSIA